VKWVCSDCGVEVRLDFEDLYLESVIKEAGCEVTARWCPLCAIRHPSQFNVEEALKIFEVMTNRD